MSERAGASNSGERPQPKRRPATRFEDVYERHFEFVWSLAQTFGVAGDALDGVVSETFRIVHTNIHALRRARYIRSWIYGIVRHVVNNEYPARAAEVSGVVLRSELEARRRGDSKLVPSAPRSRDVALLSSLLAEIDPTKREVFVLAELHALSVEEIAEALLLPPDVVRAELRTACLVIDAKLEGRARCEGRGGK